MHLVKFEDFSLSEMNEGNVPEEYPVPDEWDEEWGFQPTGGKMGVDRDDIPILLWLPKFLPDGAHVRHYMLYPFIP